MIYPILLSQCYFEYSSRRTIRNSHLNVVHLIASIGPKSFGLGPVALNLALEQNGLGLNSHIWCLDSEDDRQWASATSGLSDRRIRCFPIAGPKMIGVSLNMERIAAKQTFSDSVVHQHGIWTGISRVTNLMRKVNRTPTLVAPHGSLEQWALNKSRWKKRIALSLYEKNNLHNASCLHACSEQEVAGFRNFGLNNPIAVIPNGISHNWIKSSGDGNAFRLKFNLSPEKHIMLFLSRISPVKGLPLLMEALNAVRQHLGNWLLLVAGANEFNHQAEVFAKIKELQLKQYVKFTGLLTGQVKRDAFAAADFFVLPSKREAAPMVILEALGTGIPAITTKGVPWGDLVRYRCGWWTDVSSEGIAGALKEALSCSPEKLRAMGERGKELVETQYTWAKSAQVTANLYEWLLGRKERPDFVILD